MNYAEYLEQAERYAVEPSSQDDHNDGSSLIEDYQRQIASLESRNEPLEEEKAMLLTLVEKQCIAITNLAEEKFKKGKSLILLCFI